MPQKRYLPSDLHEELKFNVYCMTARKMFSRSKQGAEMLNTHCLRQDEKLRDADAYPLGEVRSVMRLKEI